MKNLKKMQKVKITSGLILSILNSFIITNKILTNGEYNSLEIDINNISIETLAYSEEEIKIIIIGLFVLILIFLFFICSGILIFSKDREKKDFASSTITGLNGFFIGTITGWLA